jgi:hypothetical protein
MLAALTLALLLLASPALAQPLDPPAGLSEARRYVAYDALWPMEDGIKEVTLYVVPKHQCCLCEERPECERADIDGDGVVELTDMVILHRWFGQTCSEVSDE